MPALVICGFKTTIGGDDLGQLSNFLILLRLLQLAFVVPLIIATYQTAVQNEYINYAKTCINIKYSQNNILSVLLYKGGFISDLRVYLIETTVLCIVGILIDVGVRHVSNKVGTPTEDIDKRNKLLIPILGSKLVYHAFNIYVFIHGALLKEFHANCMQDDIVKKYGNTHIAKYGYFCFILAIQGVHILFIVSVLAHRVAKLLINNKWKEKVVKSIDKLLNTDNHESIWYNRMDKFFFISKFISLGGFRVSSQDYAYIARVLDDYFDDGGTLDLVFSDILVGFIALIEIQILKTVGLHQDIYNAKKQFSLAAAQVSSAQDSLLDNSSFNSPTSYEKWVNDNDENKIDDCNQIVALPLSNNGEDRISINIPEDIEVHYTEENSDSELEFSNWIVADKKEDLNASNATSVITEKAANCRCNTNNIFSITSNNNITSSLPLVKKSFYFMIADETEHSITVSNNNISGISLPPSFQVKPLNKTNKKDAQVMLDGAYYMKFALAIYTWLIYKDKHPIFGLPRLIFHSLMDMITDFIYFVLGEKRENVVRTYRVDEEEEARPIFYNDNRIKWNEIALKLLLNINDTTKNKPEIEIIYAQFKSSVVQTVYSIILDHETKSVLVVIRGTQSLYDVVVDLQIKPIGLKEFGKMYGFDGEDEFCHDGFMTRAQWLYDDLNQHGILEGLLVNEKSKYKEYNLKILGHSLGAACAIVLSVMLRPKFLSLRCLAFCPPGCVFSDRTSSYCQEFVTSFVMNSDIIPRMSFQNLESLRDEVLELICRIRVPKSKVRQILKSITKEQQNPTKNDTYDLNTICDTFLYPVHSIPSTEFKKQIDTFHLLQKRKRNDDNIRAPEEGYLTIPGKIIHIVKALDVVHKHQQDQDCSKDSIAASHNMLLSKLWNIHGLGDCSENDKNSKYIARWASRSDFDEILITSSMVSDHMPLSVLNSLNNCASTFNATS